MNKLSAADRSIFKGFAARIMECIEDDSDNELVDALGLLNLSKTGPRKDERLPRQSYARQETSRTLVDNVIAKAAT
jgi:hypothetical protein